ncbi:ABC transporter ATP-binding protein [Acetohalobium arabaticum]|uniref:ABC transporter related protein n=1 Tax=Acetohalobium arabaticum (strain ATCC 49924 / DSM 5501 / Z-7288) TaxID=574087 RepID=D9QR14_ACEAZ|nr:ATP-binding cassette domain-containing protein [Acetohalobium arabaticum]ADL12955.1 ABC transporter related protein [Acetohalobium arabaticum DSM 5501]
MLKVSGVRKVFGQGTVNENIALRDVDLELDAGEFVTVIGSNGAGKSTLLNSIAGTFPINKGSIEVNGIELTGEPDYKRAGLIGRVFQDPLEGTAASMSIEENLAMAADRGKRRGLSIGVDSERRDEFKEYLSLLGLGLEDRLTDKVGLLSGGQRQSLTLLMATIAKPKVLLLDEHTAALDPKTAEQVIDLTNKIVGKHNLTVLMVTHDLTQALDMGTRTIMMDTGEIVLDIKGSARSHMTVEELLDKFAQAQGKELTNDRMLLAQ